MITPVTETVEYKRRTPLVSLSEAGGLYTAIVGMFSLFATIYIKRQFSTSVCEEIAPGENKETVWSKIMERINYQSIYKLFDRVEKM